MRKVIFPVLLSTFWIVLSEFLRNEVLFKGYWMRHYQNLGLIFPSAPINGAVWVLWSLFFAISVYIISREFNLIQTTFLSWFMAFVLLWINLGNLGVLPYELLIFAIPLSLLESFIASLIIHQWD